MKILPRRPAIRVNARVRIEPSRCSEAEPGKFEIGFERARRALDSLAGEFSWLARLSCLWVEVLGFAPGAAAFLSIESGSSGHEREI